jgi:hypothetical protein
MEEMMPRISLAILALLAVVCELELKLGGKNKNVGRLKTQVEFK